MHWLVCVLIVLAGSQPARGWRVNKAVDPMSDKEQLTLVLRSDDGLASLRVNCADDGNPTILLTLPPETKIETSMTLAEIRFDKDEPDAFLMEELKLQPLIASLGGAPDEKNLSFAVAADDAATVMTKGEVTRAQVAAAAKAVLGGLAKANRMVYRLTLLSSAKGNQGTFTTRGFASVAKHLGKCEPPR